MTPRQVYISCLRAVQHKRPVLIIGGPGIGKTSLAKKLAKQLSMQLFITTPAINDPTDYKGLGMASKDGSHATFLPFGQMYELLNATVPTLWFIDDLGQATNSVQATLMPWICLTNKDGVTEAWQTNEKDASLFSASSCGEPAVKAANPAQVKIEPNKNLGQLWVTSPADVTMRQLIQKWSGTVGWTLVWNVDKDIPLESSDQTTGDFKSAVRRLLSTTALSDVSIKPCFYTNQVVRVVRETTKCNPNE